MAIQTIEETIEIGYSSVGFAFNDNAEGNLFSPRLAAPGSPLTIQMITDALYWGWSGGAQTPQDLREVANYAIWLYGKYGQQSQALSGSGGQVTPINPGGGSSLQYDFIVDSVSSFILSGSSSKVFPSTWIGFNIQFFRSGQLQSITVPDFGTYFAWDSSTATLTLLAVAPSDGAAQDEERFQIYATI